MFSANHIIYNVHLSTKEVIPVVLVLVSSSAGSNFPEQLQAYFDWLEQREGDLNWKKANLAVLYFGLGPLPDRKSLILPDGRVVKCMNFNPDHLPQELEAFRPAVEMKAAARTALLKGSTPEVAAAMAWGRYSSSPMLQKALCKQNSFASFCQEVRDLQALLKEEGWI